MGQLLNKYIYHNNLFQKEEEAAGEAGAVVDTEVVGVEVMGEEEEVMVVEEVTEEEVTEEEGVNMDTEAAGEVMDTGVDGADMEVTEAESTEEEDTGEVSLSFSLSFSLSLALSFYLSLSLSSLFFLPPAFLLFYINCSRNWSFIIL